MFLKRHCDPICINNGVSLVEGKTKNRKAKLKVHEGFRGGPPGKASACNNLGSWVRGPLEKEMATHGGIFCRETLGQISLPGYSPGLQKIRHVLATEITTAKNT